MQNTLEGRLMANTTENIIRYENDTYPVSTTIEVNDSAVDLTDGWEVYLYYDEVQPDGSIKNIRVEAVQTQAASGKVEFYPRKRYCKDVTDPDNVIDYDGFQVIGKHKFSIVREKELYSQYDQGEWVYIDGEWVAYDEEVHAGETRYEKYREKMTHNTNLLEIFDRVGE